MLRRHLAHRGSTAIRLRWYAMLHRALFTREIHLMCAGKEREGLKWSGADPGKQERARNSRGLLLGYWDTAVSSVILGSWLFPESSFPVKLACLPFWIEEMVP